MNQETYRHLISGRSPRLAGIPIRLALTVLSWPYGLLVRLRNHGYTRGWFKVHHADVPVLCVGNLTAGGTGKTPLVIWLARLLMQKGLGVAILTRGYKAKSAVCPSGPALSLPKGHPEATPHGVTASGDEPAELASGCPGAAVIVNPDRVAGAAEAVSRQNAQVLVMDDGFQHRRLARDLDIVTIDATLPFGYGRLLPAGLLREPIRALRRAHAVVITRCDLVSSVRVLHIETRCRHVNRDLIVAQAVHAPIGLTTLDGDEVNLKAIQGRKVFAFCGLGNPEAFFITLRRQGCQVVGRRIFNDHHQYTARCLTDLCQEAGKHNAEFVVTTQKDGTKIACLPRPGTPARVVCLAVELRFTKGQEELTALIDSVLDSTMPSR